MEQEFTTEPSNGETGDGEHQPTGVSGVALSSVGREAAEPAAGQGSVADLIIRRVTSTPDALAFRYPNAHDEWQSMDWKAVGEQVRDIACGLISLGLKIEQRAAILASTRIEWVLADFAIMCAGGATTTIYPNNTAEECCYIITDSAARFVFAETDAHIERLAEKRSEMPNLELVVTMEGQSGHDGWVISLAELMTRGRAHYERNPNSYKERISSIRPEHLATLIYTSGTTGTPKGVELTHDCWVFEAHTMASLNIASIDDVHYLWLPLSHSFGKVLLVYQLGVGFQSYVDGRIPKLMENVAVIKPTIMAAAPRIFEKFYNKAVTAAAESGWLKLKMFTWAVGVGREMSRALRAKRRPSLSLRVRYKLATASVLWKIPARFGGQLRFFISGSAPIAADICEFFHGAGVLILEGYGLTESSAASFVNRNESLEFGTVGEPLDGVEVKIAEEDGEILLRGRGVMRGYHNLPAETAAALDADGWLHTGDIGEIDERGRLRITDRKKDLIKTSGGKYVAPQKLEGMLKYACPYISQVVVHGNGRNFCSALVTLDEEIVVGWARENGIEEDSLEALASAPGVIAMVQEAVNDLNQQLARYETIKKFAILPVEFSEATGELTASLKVKRKAIEAKYLKILDSFYEGTVQAL